MVVNIFNYEIAKGSIPKLDIENSKIITGEPSMISYLKLTNSNPIMDNNIDTNSMMFESGFKNMSYWIASIMVNHPLVIAKEDEGVYPRIREFRDFVNESCNLTQIKEKYRVYQC